MEIWRNYQGSLIPRVPPHYPIQITDEEAKTLLKEYNVHFIRWYKDFDKQFDGEFWFVIKDGPSSLEELSGNTRSKTRRGLKRLEIRKMSGADLISSDAYQVYNEANKGYKQYIQPLSRVDFEKNIRSLPSKNYHFWGVFFKEENKLIAYSQNYISDHSCEYSTIKFHPKYLKHYPSYALFFEMNNYYLNELKFRYVNDGARSIGHDTNIQNFLIEKFKFRKAYATLEIFYSKKVKLAITILYPFRSFFYNSSNKTLQKIAVLLKQHEILVNQKKVDTL